MVYTTQYYQGRPKPETAETARKQRKRKKMKKIGVFKTEKMKTPKMGFSPVFWTIRAPPHGQIENI